MPIFLTRCADLYLKQTAENGMGLFCGQSIDADEIIETCIAVQFDSGDASHVDKTNLYNYYFSLASLTDEQAENSSVRNKESGGCIALGMLSMANHSQNPNAETFKDVVEGRIIMGLKAKRLISPDQEITIRYGKTWFPISAGDQD